MDKHNHKLYYNKLGLLVSTIIITLQIIMLYHTNWTNITASPFFLIYFIIAYILTDFINGLVHMYMDNNAHYSSIIGPLIAAFHLHHRQPQYKDRTCSGTPNLMSEEKSDKSPDVDIATLAIDQHRPKHGWNELCGWTSHGISGTRCSTLRPTVAQWSVMEPDLAQRSPR